MTIQDPRLKTNIKVWISKILYDPFHERRSAALSMLIRRNAVLQKTTYEMFTFRGVAYGMIPPGPHIKPKLHPELHQEMQELLTEGVNVQNLERPYIDNYIGFVLNSSPSFQDWMRLLPEVLHSPILHLVTTTGTAPKLLSDKQVEEFKTKNEYAISLMKRRMAINLLMS